MKVKDSEAKPYIEQKDVILCRSGIQLYHKSEIAGFITEDNKPAKEREWYREYRPANVVVKAQNLFKSLPVTKEHPSEWVTPKNWQTLAGGVLDREVSVVALSGESEGEIGIKSNITFFTEELYNYYLEHKEVSVGYTCKKHFVPNPDEVGYDIILDEITEVNHLAITRAGRGGSSVAVIDSIIGGLKPMRTGIFAWIASKRQKDSAPSFGKTVLEAVKNSKGTTEEELAGEMKGVMDSCAVLKDCEAKVTLLDIVRDCFDNKDKALAEEKELVSTLDSLFNNLKEDSVKNITDTLDSSKEEKEDENKDSEEKEDENKDSEEKKEDENKDSKEEKEDENKDSEEEKKDEKEGCNKDSAPEYATKDDILKAMKEELKPLVAEAVKEVLGVNDSKASVEGSELDSKTTENKSVRDYTSFLE